MRIDIDLVRRVEHSGAEFAAQLARALAATSPDSGASAEALDGGALVSFGHGRYLNRAVGVGLGGTPEDEVVAAIETFYTERDMAPSLDVSPWTTERFVELLGAAGFRTERFRNVYVAPPTGAAVDGADPFQIERLTQTSFAARKAILGAESPIGTAARRISDEMCDTAAALQNPHDFVALVDDAPVACGSLNIAAGVGWLGGAATLPTFRGRGLQTALLSHRMQLAAELGCDVLAATAVPDGQSARNLERVGFQLLYTQAVLTRPR